MKTVRWSMVLVFVLGSMASAALTWNFEDGTTQGWYTGGDGAMDVTGAPGSYYLQNYGGGSLPDLKPQVDVNYTVSGANDSLLFDYAIFDYTPGVMAALRVQLRDSAGVWHSQDLAYVTQWSRNNNLPLSSFGFNPGNQVTGVGFGLYTLIGDAIYMDNVALVPEPVSLAVLGLGGLGIAVRRFRR